MKNQNSRCPADGYARSRFVSRAAIVCAAFLVATATAARGQSLSAPQLLPENTVAYVRIADTPELLTQLGDTAMGRMLQDPEVQPITNRLYESAAEAFRGIEDELGLSLEQLRSIPQGETCLAVVAPEQGSPILVVLVGVHQEATNARKVVEHVQAKMVERAYTKSTVMVGDTELTILEGAGEADRQTVFFEYDETIGVTSDLELAKEIVSVWRGEKHVSTLADNQNFAAIAKRCAGSSDEEPQIAYYVDPLGIARAVASNNMAFQMGLALLSQHGLDGFRGFGGSLLLGGENFESLHHMHFLVDSPRTGVLEMLAPKTGDVAPEVWVPNDVARYLTLHWDISKSYGALVETYNRVRGPDAWDEAVGRSFVSQLHINLKRDLVDALEGRITRVTWASDPKQMRRAATMTGLKLKDAAAFRQTFEKVINRSASNLFTKQNVTGGTYYQYQPRSQRRDSAGPARIQASSYVAILGDYLLLSDSELLMERAIDTKRGASPPLGDELDFKLNAGKISLLPGGDKPIMISFTRPEVGLRSSYVLIQSDNIRRNLSRLAGENRLIGAIDTALTDHPLPPFYVLAKYFAFGGRLVTSDDTGIHSMGFTFRRD